MATTGYNNEGELVALKPEPSRLAATLLNEAERIIRFAKKQLEDYASRLAVDPYRTVSESSPFRYAAQVEAWGELKRHVERLAPVLNDARLVERLRDRYVDLALNGAEDPNWERSSALMANIARREQLAVVADIARLLRVAL